MEVITANHYRNSFDFAESKTDKVEFKRNVSSPRTQPKRQSPFPRLSQFGLQEGQNSKTKRSVPFKDATSGRPMLKEF